MRGTVTICLVFIIFFSLHKNTIVSSSDSLPKQLNILFPMNPEGAEADEAKVDVHSPVQTSTEPRNKGVIAYTIECLDWL